MTPTPAPAGLPPLPVVAWMTKQTLDGKKKLPLGECSTNPRYPEVHKEWQWEPLVKLSDAIAAISAQQFPPGWRLVPVEPTRDMLAPAWREAIGQCNHEMLRRVYAAMLASAPQPAQQEGQKHLAACDGGGVTQWQPIETAPRDGTTVIIGAAGCDSGEGFWNDGKECYGHRGGAGWFWECDRSGLLTASNAHPSHWMPLPPPPARGDVLASPYCAKLAGACPDGCAPVKVQCSDRPHGDCWRVKA